MIFVKFRIVVKIYNDKINETINGTRIVSTIPWKSETMAYSVPEALVIIGNVVSMLVAPPEHIGAILPK